MAKYWTNSLYIWSHWLQRSKHLYLLNYLKTHSKHDFFIMKYDLWPPNPTFQNLNHRWLRLEWPRSQASNIWFFCTMKDRTQISRRRWIRLCLWFPFLTLKNGRGDKEYERVVATYEHFTQSTGRLAREIKKKNDESDKVEVQQHKCSKPKMLIAFKSFSSDKVDEVDDRHSSAIWPSIINIRDIKHVSRALEQYKSMNINMRLHLTYM